MPLDEFYFLRTNRNKILALNNEIQILSEKIDITKKALEENEETLYSEKYGSRVAKNGNPEELKLQVETQKELIFRLKQKNFQGKSIRNFFENDYYTEEQKHKNFGDQKNKLDIFFMFVVIGGIIMTAWAIAGIMVEGFECTNGGGSPDLEFFLASPDSAIEYCSDPTSNDVLAAEKYDSEKTDTFVLLVLPPLLVATLWKWFVFNPKRKIRKAELPFNSNPIYSDYEKNKFSYEVENELLSDLQRRLRNSSEGLSKIKSMEDQIINDKELILVNINRIEVCEKEKLELWDKINHLIPYSDVLELS